MRLALYLTIGALVLLVILLGLLLAQDNPKLPDDAEPVLGVQDVLERLTSELEAIDRTRQDAGLAQVLHLEDVEIEIAFTVNRSASANGTVTFEVITLGSEGSLSDERVQRLKLTLKPSPPRKGEVPPIDDSQENGGK